jgi:hypothetical protein
MKIQKFRKASFIEKAIKKYRERLRKPSEFHAWKLVDLTKEERKGKTLEELDMLRKQKYAEQIAKRNSMSQMSSENSMTQLFRKVQKAKQKKTATQGGK